MPLTDVVKAAVLVFFASIVQVSVLNATSILGASPDLLLVTIVAVALLRGSIYGAAVGFFAGFLVDTATLQTLGLTSLLLTLAGYWIGRYGETTGRERAHAPLVSIAVVTVLYAIGSLALRGVLGEGGSVGAVFDSLPAAVLLNLLLAVPVFWLIHTVLRPPERDEGAAEVRLLG